VLAEVLGTEPWPPPLRRTTGDKKHLRNLLVAARQHSHDDEIEKTALILGSLVLGEAAERVFESTYKTYLATTEFRLVDQRERRHDTDYRLINGHGRPLYRLNIKFHGSLFRNALQVVGLAPADCFPLATYKIRSALEKQDAEHLPYVFVVVTGNEISAEQAGSNIPPILVAAAHFGKAILSSGKRSLEEKIVKHFVDTDERRFGEILQMIGRAKWHVFSARRAEEVMKEKLFERVFALRTRAFNRAYRNAEIDMHLSFSQDMISLERFLEMIATEGHFKLAGMLERGTI
jgi:hypothetical protein